MFPVPVLLAGPEDDSPFRFLYYVEKRKKKHKNYLPHTQKDCVACFATYHASILQCSIYYLN